MGVDGGGGSWVGVQAGKECRAPAAAAAGTEKPFMSAVAGNPPGAGEDVPAPEKTDGFDGERATRRWRSR